MRPARPLVAAALLGAFAASEARAQLAQCNAVLAGGVFDQEMQRTQHSRFDSAKSFLCSDDFLSYVNSQAAGFSVTVPIEGVPVGFGATTTSQESLQRRQQFCSQQDRLLTDNAETVLLRQVASPAITRAWSDCVSSRSAGSLVQLFWEPIGAAAVRVRLQFNPAGQMPSPSVVSVALLNLQPTDQNLAGGTLIQPGIGLSADYLRSEGGDASLTVRTTIGDYAATIPRRLEGTTAGSYTVTQTSFAQDSSLIGVARAEITLPERHNQPPTPFSVTLTESESNVVLRTPTWFCVGMGDQRCAFVADLSVTQESDQRITASGTYRSRSTPAGLLARRYHRVERPVVVTSDPRPLFFGRTFIARFSRNPQANCAATGTAAWGEFAFNCRDFVSDEHFERVGMATVGDDLIYTFRVKAPGP